MNLYFLVLLSVNLALIVTVGVFVGESGTLSRKEKNTFHMVLSMTAVIAADELLAAFVDGIPGYRWTAILANGLGFALCPVLPAVIILRMDRKKTAKILSLIPVAVNLVIILSGHLFTVSEENVYSRDSLFGLYFLIYPASMIFLETRSIAHSIRHQSCSIACPVFAAGFLIFGSTIQLIVPELHITWLCVTITILLYFVYYNDLVQKVDMLTGLLNRRAFEQYTRNGRKKISGVVMMDLDGFKKVNDTYGHLTGDRLLAFFADQLLAVFQRNGYCFRFGGDEFCVILRKNHPDSLEKLCWQLESNLEKYQTSPAKLGFSCGFQSMEGGMDPLEALSLADKKMYRNKSEKQSKRQLQPILDK